MTSGDIVPKKEPVSREGVHKIKERTNIKEDFQLEFNEEEKKKKKVSEVSGEARKVASRVMRVRSTQWGNKVTVLLDV